MPGEEALGSAANLGLRLLCPCTQSGPGVSENTKGTGFRPGFPSKSHFYLLQMFPESHLHIGRLRMEEGWE